MMLKRICIVLPVMLILACLAVSCAHNEEKAVVEHKVLFTAEDAAVELNQLYPEGFIVDDTSILDEVLKTEYDLTELQSFFAGSDRCSTFENPTVLSFNEVNEQFPVEVIRPQGYSVYKVSEGGFFYVFWTKSYEMVEGKKPCKPIVYFASYIHSELEAEAFNYVEPRISTAQDVLTIDPEAEFNFSMSYGIYSYSLLNENEMMEIRYERFGDKFEGYDDLFVESMNVIPRGKESTRYSIILETDFPQK